MTRVVLLGDSHLARLDPPDLLAPEGVRVLNAAEGGAGAGDLIGQARGVGVNGDDVLVVSVGTNDAAPWKLLAIGDFTDALRGFLDEVGPARLVLLVPPGVDEARLAGHGDRTNRGVAAYAERAASLFGAADAHVLEAWALLAPLQQRAFVDDGVHLSDEGYDVLVPALREAIATVAG
jgi:lysophospholipase L1-like esterase